MRMVLTIIVNPDNTLIKDHDIEKVASSLQNSEIIPLSTGEAWDIFFDTKTNAAMSLLHSLEADWYIQKANGRRKKLLLADMDSTIITVECIDELADFAGIKAKVSVITEAAMRGQLDFSEALRERVALLRGLDETMLNTCYDTRVTLTPGAKDLIGTMTANGGYTALVSGGFTYFTGRVADEVGFDLHRANVLEIENGKLTGMVVPPICDANTKLATLKGLKDKRGLKTTDIIAVGDGANDIPMIQAAGLGIAYHAHPMAEIAADTSIKHSDLTALLFFQGYKRNEFVCSN